LQPTGEWLNQPGGLAERLMRLRKAAGLTGEKMAADLGWPRTKISKLENGRQMPKPEDITAWAAECGEPDAAADLLVLLSEGETVHRQYRHRKRTGHASIQDELAELLADATRIRNVEITFIPGLLQTAGYARSRSLEAVRVHGFDASGVDAAVQARMRRQDILYDQHRKFEFIITEAALRLWSAPPAEMLGQVDRLLSISGLPNVTLGIIPFDTELAVAPMHPFMLVDDRAYLETHTGEDLLDQQESVTYAALADGLMAESATDDEARQLLTRAAGHLRRA
jgi:transcriptional regulator with XRE-family HTH domain